MTILVVLWGFFEVLGVLGDDVIVLGSGCACAQRQDGAGQGATIWFTSAAEFEGAVNGAAIRSLVNAAVARSRSINPIDLGPQPASETARDVLRSLAAATGGTAFFDWNGSTDALVAVQQSIQSHYAILLYYSPHSDLDGKPRHVEIGCVSHPDAQLRYPSVYFPPKNVGDTGEVLEHGLELADPIVDMPLALDYSSPDGEVTLRVPKGELARTYQGGAENPAIEIVGEFRDSAGRRAANVRDRLTVPLVKETGELDRTGNAQYRARFHLPPGNYTAKFIAVEPDRRRIGTYWLGFIVQ